MSKAICASHTRVVPGKVGLRFETEITKGSRVLEVVRTEDTGNERFLYPERHQRNVARALEKHKEKQK